MTLLQETIDMLNRNEKSPSDVEWVGNHSIRFPWSHFAKLADKDYNSDYGQEYVVLDLMIVGEDWWMERHEYDGSEWWEFKQLPEKPETELFANTVFIYRPEDDEYDDDIEAFYLEDAHYATEEPFVVDVNVSEFDERLHKYLLSNKKSSKDFLKELVGDY